MLKDFLNFLEVGFTALAKTVELRVPFTYTLGMQDHINQFLQDPAYPSHVVNMQDRLTYLICIEAKYHNQTVAAPIDVFTIYRNGSFKKTRVMTCE